MSRVDDAGRPPVSAGQTLLGWVEDAAWLVVIVSLVPVAIILIGLPIVGVIRLILLLFGA